MQAEPRACVVDIETTDLGAVGMGWITCAVVVGMEKDDIPVIFRYDNYHCSLGRETKLVRALLNHLSQYDIWIGHNLRGFDYPYIKTRAAILGVAMPPRSPLYYDTWEGFRRTSFRTTLNYKGKPKGSLSHVWDMFFGRMADENPKTAIMPEESSMMIWGGKGRKRAIDKKVDHCVRDVQMNIDIFRPVFQADPRRTFKLLV